MSTLKSRLTDLKDVLVTKLNLLNTNKEDKSNKQTALTSTNTAHYPNVPAVKAGIDAAITSATGIAATYTDDALEALPAYLLASQKGADNGVAELVNGLVPSAQLPSFVDDVIDLENFVTSNPTSGMTVGQIWYNSATGKLFTATSASAGTASDPEGSKIYINKSNNQTFRWSGTAMAQMNAGLALGETSTTAYRGDRGKTAFDHVALKTNPHGVTKGQVGLSNADNTTDASKPVSTAQRTAIDVVQDDLDDYRTNDLGTNFPDYAAQATTDLNF